nr:MAG TPA: hypothetical protein [Caudoviricetes sp.]
MVIIIHGRCCNFIYFNRFCSCTRTIKSVPQVIFPAHAGVLLTQTTLAQLSADIPRTCGGAPAGNSILCKCV